MRERLEKVVGALDKIFVPGSLFRMVRKSIDDGKISKYTNLVCHGIGFVEGLRVGAYAVLSLEVYMNAIQKLG